MLLSKRRSIQLLFACLMAVGLFLSSSMAVTAQGNAATINGVNYSLDNAKGLIKVVADTTAPVQYKQSKSDNAICVEISPAVLGKNVKRNQNINTGLLQSIVVAQTSANVVLVRMNVSDTPKTSYCTALAENKGVTVAFSKNEVASAKVAKAPVAKSVAKAGSNVAPRKVAAPAKKAVAAKKARKAAKRVKVVNMEFVNADLVYIVKFLAKEMGRNVYVGPDVQGSVTVTLKNVQPEGALALVLKMQETPYDYKIVDNTVIVATTEKLQTIADNILTPKTKSSSVRRNLAEQEFVLEAVPDVGLNLDKRMGILIVEGTDEQIEQVQEVLANIDRPLKQVMLDFKVVELNETGSKNLGVQWSDEAGAMGVFNTTFAEIVPSLFYGSDRHMITNEEFSVGEESDLTAFNLGTFGRSPLLIKAALSFVVESSDSKTLASPRIATQSGEQAEVYVGQRYPIVFYDPRAGQFQVQYVDIGTKLEATPEVKDDGHVVVELTPTTSSAGNLVNNQYPITYERTAKSKVRVKDGDTIVLGGLISDSEKHSVSKLPLLGDLPIIGALFRYESHSSDRNEVVFMVTPHIMD